MNIYICTKQSTKFPKVVFYGEGSMCNIDKVNIYPKSARRFQAETAGTFPGTSAGPVHCSGTSSLGFLFPKSPNPNPSTPKLRKP